MAWELTGNQPRLSTIMGNIIYDIGLKERQSSGWGEFKACQSLVKNNIFFNMPRAAVNINDGFGGGTHIEGNLMFNTCRESGDHGPINSWDRQPFLTSVRDGTPSLVPEYNYVSRNLLIANYGAGWGVDNDDTTSWYKIYNNVLYLGGGVKCDYDGHDKYFYNNLMIDQVGGGACHHTCAYRYPYTDHCYNNTFIQRPRDNPGPRGETSDNFAVIWFCDKNDPSHIIHDYNNGMLPVVHSNKIYNSDGRTANVTCGYSGAEDETIPLIRFMEVGLMENTTVGKIPEVDTITGWAKELLLMH